MRDLYTRLRRIGFEQRFVRERLLPDWWDDSLGSDPASRAIAEMAIARLLGLPMSDLQDRERPLTLPSLARFRLKARAGVQLSDMAPALALAAQVAAIAAQTLGTIPRFGGLRTALQSRERILQSRGRVDLAGLLEYSWESGIPVLHLAQLPPRKFTGLALFSGELPVIVLASGSDSPPWIAFHLAHELGHVLLGHVTPGSVSLVDDEIAFGDDIEGEEADSDRFACEVLTGIPRPTARPEYGLTAPLLVDRVRARAESLRADPGVIALMYGKNANRMPVAQAALKRMGLSRGAKAIIEQALRRRLPDELPETAARVISLLAAA